MSKIFLKSATNDLTIERELRKSETIMDIRRYLSQHLNTDMGDIKIAFNGKIVTDAIPVGHLEKNGDVTLDFIIKRQIALKDEVEMQRIDQNVRIKIIGTGEKRSVNPKNVVTHEGQLFYIQKRENRFNVINDLREAMFSLRMDIVIKVAMIVALFMTNNREFGIMLSVILLLRGINTIRFRVKMKNLSGCEFIYKSVVSFFVSMFMLNSDQILDFRTE